MYVADSNNPMSGLMQDLAFSIPGVDEAMNFAEVMKQVNSMEYSVIIFDTAPTGHASILIFSNCPRKSPPKSVSIVVQVWTANESNEWIIGSAGWSH